MDGSRSCKFNIFDMMVFVAATALGLVAIRYYVTTPAALVPVVHGDRISFEDVPRHLALTQWATIGSLLLAAWSPAVILVAFRPPRPRLGRLIQSPGVMAAAGATLMLGAFFASSLRGGWPIVEVPAMSNGQQIMGRIDLFPTQVLEALKREVGPIVLVAWAMVAAMGRGRGATNRVEFAGLAVGVGWLMLYVHSRF